MVGSLRDVLYLVPIVLISLTIHELSHAYVSDRLGDPTPRNNGRLTLNPIRHLDPLGTLLFFVAGVGWAKPVPINPMYYRDRKKGTLVVSAAGPMSNLLLAFVSSIVIILLTELYFVNSISSNRNELLYTIYIFFTRMYWINISFVAFNLLPIPPLDGSKVLAAVLPDRQYFRLMQYEHYIGMFFILVSFLRPGIIGALISPLVWFFDTAIKTVTGLLSGII